MEFLFQFVTELLSSSQEEDGAHLAIDPIVDDADVQEFEECQNIFSLGEFH